MTYFEAKEDLKAFFNELGLSKENAEKEFIKLYKMYSEETQIVIREALKEYIIN